MRTMTVKPIHLKKLAAIIEVKGKAMFSKNFIIMPVFALGFTFLMDVIYGKMTSDATGMNAYALALGVLMNISMTGIYCVSAGLAEEKEKKTLRTLMTSSVNGLEFFLGSLIPAVLMTTVVNILCVFIVQLEMDPFQWGQFLIVTTAAALIASVIGMIFGIFAKDQVSASTITTPGILIFMMFPMFSGLSEKLESISSFLFTGIVFDGIADIHAGAPAVDLKGSILLVIEFIISVAIFLSLYRKNGFER